MSLAESEAGAIRPSCLSRLGAFAASALLLFMCRPTICRAVDVLEAKSPTGPRDFTITAGNAFFDHTPSIGALCTFDFGDPGSPYNTLRGYNAAHIYTSPGTYTLHCRRVGEADIVTTLNVEPDRRPVIRVQPGENLMDVIRGLTTDAVVELARGGVFSIPGPTELKIRNVEFRAAPGGGPAPRIVRLSAKGSSTFIVQGLDITFRGLEFDSDKDIATFGNTKVNMRAISAEGAHLVVDQCTFRNLDDDVFCTAMTRGVLVRWSTFTDETRSCDVWLDGGDVTILGNRMGTSQREHNIRCSTPRFSNLLVDYNDLTNAHGKETLTFRSGNDCYAAHNTFHGWVRVGPGPHSDGSVMGPEELARNFCRHCVIEKNAFMSGGWLQVNEGTTDVLIRGNRFDVDQKSVAIHVQGPSVKEFHAEYNYRVLTEGRSPKPMIRAWKSVPGDVDEKESSIKTDEEAKELKGK